MGPTGASGVRPPAEAGASGVGPPAKAGASGVGPTAETAGVSSTEGVRLVVAAAIVDDLSRPTRVLAARRTGPPALAGRWEFPGGKVEPGEDPVSALHRELAEELDLTVTLGSEPLSAQASAPGQTEGPYWRLGPTAVMRLWLAVVAAGEIDGSTDHDQLRWVGAADLPALDWLPGDRAVVAALVPLLATT